MQGVSRLHGAFSNLGPLLFIAAISLYERHAPDAPRWVPQAAALVGVLTSLGGALFPFRALAGRLMATLGLGLFLALCARPLSGLPQQTLLILILVSSALYLLWTAELPVTYVPRVPAAISSTRAAGFMALAGWFAVVPLSLAKGTAADLAVATLMGIAGVFAVRWFALEIRGRRRKLARGARETAIDATISPGPWDLLLVHPERMLILTFLALSATGSLLLSLPQSAAGGVRISGIDAAFTAVSAVCVTGLSVRDVASTFSPFGQFVMVVLIQTGGLGIMTFSTAALSLMGRRLSVRHEAVVASLSGEHRSEVMAGIRRILLVTLCVETVGAAFLWLAFMHEGDPAAYGLWRAIFTAVSAFCNAGFGLQPDSLVPYQSNAIVLHTVALLIVLGGLSPATILALPRLLARRPVPLQARLVWLTTAAILCLSFVAILTFEWRHSLDGMSIVDRINNAWLTAVAPRTAGFNSVDLLELHPASVTLMIALMFVGGSPGGTAGGVKTTTLAVLILAVVAAFRGEKRVTAFNRFIPHETVYRTAAIVTAGLFAAGFLLLLLQLTQNMPAVAAVFEVMSALGTVGLTVGGTPLLDGVGKGIIMLAMFAGRVGPLSIFLFLAESRRTAPWSLPEEQIGVS